MHRNSPIMLLFSAFFKLNKTTRSSIVNLNLLYSAMGKFSRWQINDSFFSSLKPEAQDELLWSLFIRRPSTPLNNFSS